MDVERLIDSVRRHVFLYDLNHVDYKNVSLKAAVWETIGMELNQNADAVKNKWKTIRDGYTKYKKLLKRTTGSCKKNIQYMWSSQLSFLDDYNNVPRSKSSNAKEVSPSPSPPPQLHQDSDHSQDYLAGPSNQSMMMPLPPSQVLSLELLESMPSTSNNQGRRSKRNDLDDMETVANFLNKKKKKEHDGIDHLFLSYADTFKRFPPREQALMKLELAKLFTDTELRLIDNTNGAQAQTHYAAAFFKNDFNN